MDYPTVRDFTREVRELAKFYFDLEWEHGGHLKELTKKELIDYLSRLEEQVNKTVTNLGFRRPYRGM